MEAYSELSIQKKYTRSGHNYYEELILYHNGDYRHIVKVYLKEEVIISDELISLGKLMSVLNEGNWVQTT